MAATVKIFEMTGTQQTGVGTGVDKTSSTVRFKSADETSVDTTNRLVVPSAGGTTYSYVKQLQFYFHTPPSTDITNMRVYSDGTNGFGAGIQLFGTVGGTTGGRVNTTNATPDDFFNFKNTSSLRMLGTSTHGTFTGTLFKGGLLNLQMRVGPGAGPGTTPVEIATFSYDES